MNNPTTLEIPSGIKVLNPYPLDDRTKVQNLTLIANDPTLYIGFSPIYSIDDDKNYYVSSGSVGAGWSFSELGGGAGTTNLTSTYGASNVTINSDTGTNATIVAATTSIAGVMAASDKNKLNGIDTGAEVNVQSDWNATTGDAVILNKPISQLIPSGGTANQVLSKDSSTDYDVSWQNASGGIPDAPSDDFNYMRSGGSWVKFSYNENLHHFPNTYLDVTENGIATLQSELDALSPNLKGSILVIRFTDTNFNLTDWLDLRKFYNGEVRFRTSLAATPIKTITCDNSASDCGILLPCNAHTSFYCIEFIHTGSDANSYYLEGFFGIGDLSFVTCKFNSSAISQTSYRLIRPTTGKVSFTDCDFIYGGDPSTINSYIMYWDTSHTLHFYPVFIDCKSTSNYKFKRYFATSDSSYTSSGAGGIITVIGANTFVYDISVGDRFRIQNIT